MWCSGPSFRVFIPATRVQIPARAPNNVTLRARAVLDTATPYVPARAPINVTLRARAVLDTATPSVQARAL